jgi:hypothetical protein
MVKVRIGNDNWMKHVAGDVLIQVKTPDEIRTLLETLTTWRDFEFAENGNNYIRVQYQRFVQKPTNRDDDEFFK